MLYSESPENVLLSSVVIFNFCDFIELKDVEEGFSAINLHKNDESDMKTAQVIPSNHLQI